MRLHQLIRYVYHEPSLIVPSAHASVRHLLDVRLAEGVAQREGTGVCGEEVELPQMKIEGGIADIPVGGIIGVNLSLREKGAGAVDTNDIARELETAIADKSVRAILFDIDSPGGMVNGTPELADKIASCPKPTFAFTTGQMCSAAYWIGSATTGIFSTRTGEVGSIGVYLPIFDETRAFEMQGVKVELIKAGKLKGTGFPGIPLSDMSREYLQDRVNEIYTQFKAHVKALRGEIADDTMQGQTFMGVAAMSRGLVDGIVASKAECLALIREYRQYTG